MQWQNIASATGISKQYGSFKFEKYSKNSGGSDNDFYVCL